MVRTRNSQLQACLCGVTDLRREPKNDEEEKSGATGTECRTCFSGVQHCRIDHCAGGNDDWSALREIDQLAQVIRKSVILYRSEERCCVKMRGAYADSRISVANWRNASEFDVRICPAEAA